MTLNINQMAKLYADVAAAASAAQPSLTEVRRLHALMCSSANKLEANGHQTEADAMRSEARQMFVSNTVRRGSSVDVASAATVTANLKRLSKRLRRLEERVLRLEANVNDVLTGRRAQYDPNTGQLIQPEIPGYWDAIRHALHGRRAQYDPNTGELLYDSTPGVYNNSTTIINQNGNNGSSPKFHWLVPVLVAVVAVLVAWVIGTWYNGATYAGWIAGVGAVLAAILLVVMNIPYFRRS